MSSSPAHHHEVPRVRVGCTLASRIEVVPFGDARLGREFGCGGWSLSFSAGKRIVIEEHVVTSSERSSRWHAHHDVFVPERGRR
ncbi:hypothetical protein AB0J43_00185 [Nonomuraea fuscirosea]